MTAPQTDQFVPLTTASPAANGRGDFRVLVTAAPKEARPFAVHHAAAPSVVPSQSAPPSTCEPQVALQRDGDRVTGIQIRCSCGQVIDLVCYYGGETAR